MNTTLLNITVVYQILRLCGKLLTGSGVCTTEAVAKCCNCSHLFLESILDVRGDADRVASYPLYSAACILLYHSTYRWKLASFLFHDVGQLIWSKLHPHQVSTRSFHDKLLIVKDTRPVHCTWSCFSYWFIYLLGAFSLSETPADGRFVYLYGTYRNLMPNREDLITLYYHYH